MDKGRFVSACMSGNVTLAVNVVFTSYYLQFVVFVDELDGYTISHTFFYSFPRIAFKLDRGIRILPLGSHIVAEHKPAEESTYEGGDYLNSLHKTNSNKEVRR